MSWRLGGQRVLDGIGRDLADSDPCLDELFARFNQRAYGGKMPGTEKIRKGPLGLICRLGSRVRPEPVDYDRMANWWL
jgi:hypothetical protein